MPRLADACLSESPIKLSGIPYFLNLFPFFAKSENSSCYLINFFLASIPYLKHWNTLSEMSLIEDLGPSCFSSANGASSLLRSLY
jgi:hypothetical protein